MAVPNKHILQQGPVIAAIGKAAVHALKDQVGLNGHNGQPSLPSVLIEAKVPPRPRGLIKDYVRSVGGDTASYKKTLPPHLFPQWAFPVASKSLADIPYPLVKVINAGCRIEIGAPLPSDEQLTVTGQLVSIDDDGTRALLHTRLVTSTQSAPEALVAHMYAYVPLKEPNGEQKTKKKPKAQVPQNVRELSYRKVRADAGLDFAKLTGDFNPIHWIPAYAKASGFRSTILHGYATMARAYEAIARSAIAPGERISVMDVKFTRPLTLPAQIGVYVDAEGGVYVGDAPGGPAYMVGTYEVTR